MNLERGGVILPKIRYTSHAGPRTTNRHPTTVNVRAENHHATNTSHWEGGRVGVVRNGDAKNTIPKKQWRHANTPKPQDPDLNIWREGE